jgi:hypothetical protein
MRVKSKPRKLKIKADTNSLNGTNEKKIWRKKVEEIYTEFIHRKRRTIEKGHTIKIGFMKKRKALYVRIVYSYDNFTRANDLRIVSTKDIEEVELYLNALDREYF